LAHGQIAEYTGIPKAYYDRMAGADPALLAANVNRWMHDDERAKDKRMVRTLDGKVRAMLSNKYRPLENEELAEAILPVMLESGLLVLSAEITERRMYIKAVDKKILKDIPTGCKLGEGHNHFDTLSPGIIVSNSEVGYGALSIEDGVYTGGCTNLMIGFKAFKKYHTGARAELSDDVYALLTDQTKRLTDAAVWGQVRDIVSNTLSQVGFEKRCESLVAATTDPIGDEVVEVIERVGKRFQVAETERKGILRHLIEGGDLTRYGLHSAITRHSADVEDYDRATELERLGGQIIDLPRTQWGELLKAA